MSLITFQCRDLVEEGVDPFEENIQNMYYTADPQGKGYITREEFISVSSWPHEMVGARLLLHSLPITALPAGSIAAT